MPEQELDLPPYTYVPGVVPHPISDPRGHMFDAANVYEQWSAERVFNRGVQLFECGYYWESHEAWEHLWLKLGRTTPDAIIVKGLIKLAACGVKCLERNTNGATRHAKRATQLLQNESQSAVFNQALIANAREIAAFATRNPPVPDDVSDGQPVVLDGFGRLSDKPDQH